ncbi:aminoacyltransferase [Staphylococcus pseudintermedius]|nr:aminoacyltransferase [Staphylococcus pseudintermedius]
MYFCELNIEEFDRFMKSNFSHYTQSIQNYDFLNKEGKRAYLVGVKNNDGKILAACLLNQSRALKYFNYFYTHRGPVMDYRDVTLVEFFFTQLDKFLKKHNCLYIRVDPHVLQNIRNANGEVLKSYDNRLLILLLARLGYKHQGYDIGYSKIRQIRWLSVLDLSNKSFDDLLKNMSYQTRRNIKKTEEMGVQVKTLPIEQTDRFFELFKMAEEKHGFSFRDKNYFEKMQRVYKDNGMLKMAFINLDDYLRKVEKELIESKTQLDELKKVLSINPNSKKSKNKYKQINEKYEKLIEKKEDTTSLKKEYGNILDLAAALYVYNNHEVYYLSSGSNPKFNEFMGAYALQWEMIKFAKENNIDKYNFYGITGDFSDSAEDFGVQQFKKGFNAHVEEYIGDFIKPFKPLLFKLFTLRNKI